MKNKLCLMACTHFRDDLAQALKEEKLADVELVPLPADCDRPLHDPVPLRQAVAQCRTGTCVVLGGHCLNGLAQQLPPQITAVEPAGNCFELFADSGVLQPLLDRGAHLLTPGMLRHWRRSYEEWGFTTEDARAFFAESHTTLVLLDTGTDPGAEKALRVMAEQLDLPWERVPVGLDHLCLQLHRIIARNRVHNLRTSEQKLSDYAMVHDLTSGITALTDEQGVIRQLMELFSMFCAPAELCYLPLYDGKPGELHCLVPPADPAGKSAELMAMNEAHRLDRELAGFRINITRDAKRIGTLALRGIAFPKYLSHYLNLSLNIAPVIALAISNARTYQAHLEAKRQVQDLNGELKERLITVDALNKELETFTYSVSHDLRAPLRSLDGFTNILLRDYAQTLPPQGQKYLDRLRVNAKRMGQLIEDLLRLSRLTRAEISRRTVDLAPIARGLAEDLAQTSPQRRVRFEIADGLQAHCDAPLIRVVLENLIGNAWKYTGKVDEAVIEFGREQQGGRQVFYVRDNGDGFDMVYAETLFSPFQRLHSDAEFPGTGIGLATVQRIIQRHGGSIWAESAKGQGASFYFTV